MIKEEDHRHTDNGLLLCVLADTIFQYAKTFLSIISTKTNTLSTLNDRIIHTVQNGGCNE